MPYGPKPVAPEIRFWRHVDKDGPASPTFGQCWLWTGATAGPGKYGVFVASPSRVNGTRKHIYAHRFAYEIAIGPIPDGMEIDHLCKTPRCVRSEHLEIVTRRENVLRSNAPSAKHAVKTHCPQGHPYDETNTYLFRNMRQCKTCRKRVSQEWWASHKKGST